MSFFSHSIFLNIVVQQADFTPPTIPIILHTPHYPLLFPCGIKHPASLTDSCTCGSERGGGWGGGGRVDER